MKKKFHLIAAFLLLVTARAMAQDKPLLIENSRSPDGSMELWIKPDSYTGEVAAGIAQIREVKSGRIVGTFHWAGFGERPDSNAFKLLWRPDCKCFAIEWELTRGYVTCAVYALDKKKDWVEVKLPTDDYVKAIKKMNGVPELRSGKGHDMPEKWLADGQLVIEFGSRDIWYDDNGDEKTYEVTLRVTGQENNPLQVAQIKAIKLKPRKASSD